jgi:hypothetical protein
MGLLDTAVVVDEELDIVVDISNTIKRFCIGV